LVTYQSPTPSTPIPDSQFLSVSPYKIIYKIPVNQIKDIQIRKADRSDVGTFVGVVIDVFMLLVILGIRSIDASFNSDSL